MAEIKTLTVNGKTYKVTDPAAANAIRGTVSGNPVCITDCSPVEHEMAVQADAPGATVIKCGKNLVNLDAMLRHTITKDENGIYHITGDTLAFNFAVPIPANTPVTITFVGLNGHNSNSDALIVLSKAYTDGTAGQGVWLGVSERMPNKVTFKYNSDFLRFSIMPYNKSADYWCEFSAVQLEIGETATEYEPYKEPVTYTADENGVVEGIVGNGEAMTLFADSGATVTAQYNKDTNKVVESLVNAIISLGGNV